VNEEYTPVKRLLTVIAALAVIGIPIVGRADDSTNRLPTNTDFSQGGFYQYGSGTHSIPGWDIRYDGPNGFGLYPGKYYAIPYSSDVVDLDYGGQISTAADSRASVTAGRVYKFTLDVQHTDGFTYEVKGATPSIQFFDAGGNLLQNIPSMDIQNADPSLSGVQTFGWETGSTTALTQAGAVSASVSAYGPRGGYPNDYSCKWHMTNFRLTTVSETRDHPPRPSRAREGQARADPGSLHREAERHYFNPPPPRQHPDHPDVTQCHAGAWRARLRARNPSEHREERSVLLAGTRPTDRLTHVARPAKHGRCLLRW